MEETFAQAGSRPSQANDSVTLEDVARLAGVTAMTVSRTLKRPELVREETRQRVMDAVRATGYVPNLLAGALATNKSHLIALLLPTIATSIFTDMVQSLMTTLAPAGYQTLLGLTDYLPEREEQLVGTLLGRRPDAIVLTGTEHSPLTRERLRRTKVPIIEIWDLTDDPIDMLIGFSHEAVGMAVARHLLSKGYRRFAVLSADDPRGVRRSTSLIDELKRHGAGEVPMVILPAPATLQTGREGLVRLLDRGLPDVIVCSTDTLAQGILAEAAKRGIDIPRDVAVMGFGDLSTAAHVHPSLSTVRIDGASIGRLAAEALVNRLDAKQPAEPALRVDTGFTIIDRESA
ncbi:LacI family DNA-binding transcriptional regulator [Caballeronia sp. LZ062]|uniref:LacI family DNA-binding transcriptional regulator n=1 Tax=unclassified Caballeronia TaxID=2646786 RepID=UPI002858C4D8|nr:MULTISPECIES: LacI family DNA-binding transcriptional regulator [unclassified Caballeronia]MDR5857718.1 LacI family DNA-binding transcriptional regulator [Caballeronia sp. LZ050]MDR5869268.1 LacI family DNA-binding transcriptional regulator [Caballeronia sp. LZ062]